MVDDLSKPPVRSGAPINFVDHGAQHFTRAAWDVVGDIGDAVSALPARPAGTRLFSLLPLAPILDQAGPLTAIAQSLIGRRARPVRALLFDKHASSNWSLGWHQDRVIAVRERIEVAGFTNWTVKSDVDHVSTPWPLLSRMLTLRVHLDRVENDNAPLLIAPGSHRLGLIPISAIDDTVRTCGIVNCLAQAGDVWVYSTPILHASAATTTDRPRRVLQLDYAAFDLPGGLRWKGL